LRPVAIPDHVGHADTTCPRAAPQEDVVDVQESVKMQDFSEQNVGYVIVELVERP